MQFRRFGLRSIGPSSQELWPNLIFGPIAPLWQFDLLNSMIYYLKRSVNLRRLFDPVLHSFLNDLVIFTTMITLNLGRYSFRCDHYYEDGSCYGGPDGGGCNKRRKREELKIQEPGQPQISGNSSMAIVGRDKRQTDDVIGCQKEETNGVDYRGRAGETVEGVPCMKWTEGFGGKWSSEGEHNFCRNPSDNPNGVWCTTSTNKASSSIGYCNVPKCDRVIKTREVECVDWVGGRARWKWDWEIPNTCSREFIKCSRCNIFLSALEVTSQVWNVKKLN